MAKVVALVLRARIWTLLGSPRTSSPVGLEGNISYTAWDSRWNIDKLYALDELCFWLKETGFIQPES